MGRIIHGNKGRELSPIVRRELVAALDQILIVGLKSLSSATDLTYSDLVAVEEAMGADFELDRV